ncbi:MAG: PhoH family protein [Proteobacteria bacterium]|nr:PhoH family protein [Burkholderiales bacterium]
MTPPRTPGHARPLQVAFTPIDNARLANLCGPLDENLRAIERALEVKISRRGATFSLAGELTQARIAASALQRFYTQAHREVSLEDVQLGLVEAGRNAGTDGQAPEPGVEPAPGALALLTRRPDLHARTPAQQQYLEQIREFDITFGIGPAGTGKTYLAVASAVDSIERDQVKRIVLVRPAVEAGERLGFLPGDLAQKVDPYLRPLYDALYDLMGFDKVGRLFERSAIEVAPLAYMRGRTLNQSFIILDEAQNTTPEQMKMFLTRIGFGTRAVITGDVTQIDLARGQKSGLIDAKSVLADVRGIGFTYFSSADVVRHPIVQRIVDAYEKRQADDSH